jgi:hypothetical protein
MTPWLLIGWLAALALYIGLRAKHGPMMNEDQSREDADQAAYLAAWMKRRNAVARGDTRGQKEALDGLQSALHAKLRAELGQ